MEDNLILDIETVFNGRKGCRTSEIITVQLFFSSISFKPWKHNFQYCAHRQLHLELLLSSMMRCTNLSVESMLVHTCALHSASYSGLAIFVGLWVNESRADKLLLFINSVISVKTVNLQRTLSSLLPFTFALVKRHSHKHVKLSMLFLLEIPNKRLLGKK